MTSICESSRCYRLAYLLRKFLLNIMFVGERIEKDKHITRFKVLGVHFSPFCKNGFGCLYTLEFSDEGPEVVEQYRNNGADCLHSGTSEDILDLT